MKNKSGNKKFKGFTLVEVMTSLVIMTILIAVASAVIIVTFDIFARTALRRAAQNNGNNVYNYIYDHLSYATALKIDKSVDINNKDNIEQLMKDLNYSDSELEDVVEYIESDSGETAVIRPYYEIISANRTKMTVSRKGITSDVLIYGKADDSGESSSDKENAFKSTMNGCDCIISFKKYNSEDDTIEFSVAIVRDGETFYEKAGSIPILNDDLKSHISVDDISISVNDSLDNTDDSSDKADIEIFYTYIW